MKTDREILMEVFLEEGIPLKLRKRIARHLGSSSGSTIAPQANGSLITRPLLHAQAPSTQRLLDAQEAAIAQATASGTILLPLAMAPKPLSAAKRIVGGEVATGNGTRGPKKW